MNVFPNLRSIYWKFLAVVIPVMGLAALVFLVIYTVLIRSTMERELGEKLLLLAEVHSHAVAEPLWTLNLEGLERSVKTIVVHPEISCAEVLETNDLSRYHWPANCQAILNNEQPYTSELRFHNQLVGQLNLYYTNVPLIKVLTREVIIGALFFFLLASVAGILAFAALRLIVGAPLSRLLKSIKITQRHDEGHLIDWSSNDEMGSVIDAYNRMIEKADADTQKLVLAREEAELAVQAKSMFLPTTIHADPTRLRQIIFNLLGNACKFTHQGVITLQATDVSDPLNPAVCFSVIDTGIGIAEEKLGTLFDEFSQADNYTTRQHNGAGLGLAISQRLCQLMGGSINVKSVEGEGTTFFFQCPLAQKIKSSAESLRT